MPRNPRKLLDVLFIAYDDNANTGYRFWQCARALGLNAIMFKGKRHPFGYPSQAPIHPSLSSTPYAVYPTTLLAPGLESLLESAHVVHLLASTFPIAAFDWSKANVVVQHGGTVYRQNPAACNQIFNQIAKKAVIQCPDLLGLGAKNEHLIYYPVDTRLVKPDCEKRPGEKLVIGHFPSNASVKGTDAIRAALQEFKTSCDARIDTGLLPWEKNLVRIKQCDIIVETCAITQNQKAYGEWGNTALEASASGAIVITNTLTSDIYKNEYGARLPFFIANNGQEISDAVRQLLAMSSDDLQRCKREHVIWAHDSHGIDVTARRLWDKVYKDFF